MEEPEVSRIRALVYTARRRMRLQAALDGATTAVIPAIALGFLAFVLVRSGAVSGRVGIELALVVAGVVIAGAIAGAARRQTDERIARRIDRVSGLADRLSSAIAFAGIPDRSGFRRAAIADANRALDRARVFEATPYRMPRNAPIAAGCLAIACVIGGVTLVPAGAPTPATSAGAYEASVTRQPGRVASAWIVDDVTHSLERLRGLARVEESEGLAQLAASLDRMLELLQTGAFDKETLLARFNEHHDTITDNSQLSAAARSELGDLRLGLQRLRQPHDLRELSKPHPHHMEELVRPSPQPHAIDAPLGQRGDGRFDRSSDGGGGGSDPSVQSGGTSDPALAGTRTTLASVALHGVAVHGYAKVYARYMEANEQIMRSEQLPSGYRFVVRRYFDRIKPRGVVVE